MTKLSTSFGFDDFSLDVFCQQEDKDKKKTDMKINEYKLWRLIRGFLFFPIEEERSIGGFYYGLYERFIKK